MWILTSAPTLSPVSPASFSMPLSVSGVLPGVDVTAEPSPSPTSTGLSTEPASPEPSATMETASPAPSGTSSPAVTAPPSAQVASTAQPSETLTVVTLDGAQFTGITSGLVLVLALLAALLVAQMRRP